MNDSDGDKVFDILKNEQPKIDEFWWVRYPSRKKLHHVFIKDITKKLVILDPGPGKAYKAFKRDTVEFIERSTNEY